MILTPAFRHLDPDAPASGPPLPQNLREPAGSPGRSGRVRLVVEAAVAAEVVGRIRRSRAGGLGADVRAKYDRPVAVSNTGRVVYDPRSICPVVLGLAVPESEDGGTSPLQTFVIDLRDRAVWPALRGLVELPTPFVAHDARPLLYALWHMGLPDPAEVWDTDLCERALNLGRYHRHYRQDAGGDLVFGADLEREEEDRYGLGSVCLARQVAYLAAGAEGRLDRMLDSLPGGDPVGGDLVDYVVARAAAVARLYPIQTNLAVRAGILRDVITVEMPFAVTAAHMTWNGVRIDPAKAARANTACTAHLAGLEPKLRSYGIGNVRSRVEMESFFRQIGLIRLFRRHGEVTFDKNLLEQFEDRHPAIPLIRAARRVHELLAQKFLTGEQAGTDGRLHPHYASLGCHTGRLTCRFPNVMGLGRVFRPLVVPEPGFGIGEVDLSQIEVGVAAGVYRDGRLAAMFNGGDVYAVAAQEFFKDRLDGETRSLSSTEFKRRHPALRETAKQCLLGILYGLTPFGLKDRLQVTGKEARDLIDGFLTLFPELRQNLRDAVAIGRERGYAVTSTGLRRHRADPSARSTFWEENWFKNHPVQGSAAAAFKRAGTWLDRLYPKYGARPIVPVHDAFVFEAPLDRLCEVAELTRQVMCEAVKEQFPVLDPRADVNVSDPSCWNKDGRSDSLDRWLADPMFRF